MENGETNETELSESYLTQPYAVMEGKFLMLVYNSNN